MLVGSGRFRSRLLSCSFCSLFVDSPAPDVLDALAPVLKVFSTRLLVRGPNSSSLNRASICATSTVPNVRSSISTPRSTSRTSALTLRLSLTWSILARSDSPFLPPISSACSQMPSREPNWLIHLAAKPSPTPGTPGILSAVSPRSAARSGYCAGVTLYLSMMDCGVICFRSLK